MRNVTLKCSLASWGKVAPVSYEAEPGATETHSHYRIENVPDGVTDDQVAAMVNQCGIWHRFVLDWSELRPGVIIMDISTAALAEDTGKSEQWIRRIAPELEAAGLAYRNEDGRWKFRRPQAAEWVENRPDNRGRPSASAYWDRRRAVLMTEEMKAEIAFDEIAPGKYEVFGCPIRGWDWKLVRSEGQGTYAIIAGDADDTDADDEEFVVEEIDDPERREAIDSMAVMEAIEMAYNDIMESKLD